MNKRDLSKIWKNVDKIAALIESDRLPTYEMNQYTRGWITKILKHVRWVNGHGKECGCSGQS